MLKVFEAFSGIGTQRMALRNLGIEHEVVCIAEIDKFAIRSYESIHGETLNLGDVSKIDPNDVPDHDLFTYSFPCQDISVAGKGKGFKPESGTRSSLLWECEKIIEAKKPKYLLMENVKALIFKKFKPGFKKWLRLLEELGYTNYWQVLNAKDYGIPQNRERVFCVSILGTHEPYVFPEPFELKRRLKDVLEDEVDEKFYLSEEHTRRFVKSIKSDKFPFGNEYKVVGTTKAETEPSVNQVGMLDIKGNEQIRRVYGDNGVSPTLNSMQGGNRQPKILQVGNVNPSGKGMNGNVFDQKGLSPTITTNKGEGLKILESTGIDKSYNNPEIIECANCITAREDRGISNRKAEGTAVLIPQATKQGYIECNVPGVADLSYPNSKTRRGRVQEKGEIVPTITAGQQDICYIDTPCIAASRGRNPDNPSDRTAGNPMEQRLEINQNGTSNTITTVQKDNYVIGPQYRIRKLTPKECWRLMGISDEDFEKAQEVNSNTQLYKQAGNAIVVDVLEGIFRKLFLSKSKEKGNKLEEQLDWLDDLLGVGT